MFTPIPKPAKVAKQVINLSDDLRKEIISIPTTSKRIRYLSAKGYTKGSISKILDIRYQHVYNTLKSK